jgi:UDP:flavonoid glycosyltransferase YjiC (YdhE family)
MPPHGSHGEFLQDGRVRLDTSRLHDHFHVVRSGIERSVKNKRAKITFGTHVQKCERLQPFVGAPRMNIAILITGSRGDVQPFIALGKKLQESGHRVRIGTHGNFRELVKDNGLEFYSIGGDPELLMAYMVKNPGVLPSLDSVKAGDVGSRKADLEEMLMGAWRACTESCDEHDRKEHIDPHQIRPFVADAIISNPPTYASLHIAERLAIPLHFMFTMPWSPTTAFPHPLAQMDSSRTDAGVRNYLSYTQIELLTCIGLTDIINRFRRRTLLLEPVDPTWGTNLVPRLKVPFTYCWSPALIPKPADWGAHIGVSGFFFLPSDSTYQPDPKLQAFLDAGELPVYIGFGSIVIDDPDSFTKLILEAVKKAGVRALVSKGWSNVGGTDVPDNIFLLGNVPHDWLFQRVSAVVHHGGAGTCAIGLALGRPTVIVPFFGDQFWWAGIVQRAGAGPQAVPYKKLTSDNLADNIREALKPETKAKAQELSEKMKGEDGVSVAAEQFHNLQSTKKFACFLCPDRTSVWRVRRTNVNLSAFAVAVLTKHGRIQPRDIKL